MDETENLRKCTSEDLTALLSKLSTDQLRYVVARQQCPTDKEAAEAIGMDCRTIYKWPAYVKEAARLMTHDGVVTALHIRRRNLAKAMMVKTAGLDSDDEPLRQRVSTEIIEWELGKALQKSQIAGSGGGPLLIELGWGDDAMDDDGAENDSETA